jgi:peptidoglycan hydrolase CwlO-like protein
MIITLGQQIQDMSLHAASVISHTETIQTQRDNATALGHELVELNRKLEKRVKDLEVECAGLEARQEVMKIDEAQALDELQEANRALKAARKVDFTEQRNDKPPAAQCSPNSSRPTQSKRQPSSEVTAPRAKRSRISEPTPLSGQKSEVESGAALSIKKAGEPTFAEESIPRTI